MNYAKKEPNFNTLRQPDRLIPSRPANQPPFHQRPIYAQAPDDRPYHPIEHFFTPISNKV